MLSRVVTLVAHHCGDRLSYPQSPSAGIGNKTGKSTPAAAYSLARGRHSSAPPWTTNPSATCCGTAAAAAARSPAGPAPARPAAGAAVQFAEQPRRRGMHDIAQDGGARRRGGRRVAPEAAVHHRAISTDSGSRPAAFADTRTTLTAGSAMRRRHRVQDDPSAIRRAARASAGRARPGRWAVRRVAGGCRGEPCRRGTPGRHTPSGSRRGRPSQRPCIPRSSPVGRTARSRTARS